MRYSANYQHLLLVQIHSRFAVDPTFIVFVYFLPAQLERPLCPPQPHYQTLQTLVVLLVGFSFSAISISSLTSSSYFSIVCSRHMLQRLCKQESRALEESLKSPSNFDSTSHLDSLQVAVLIALRFLLFEHSPLAFLMIQLRRSIRNLSLHSRYSGIPRNQE